MQGFIKLHRQILEWEWYKDANTMRLFLHFLLKANHKEKKWQGHTIDKGSFITSLDNLVIETGLSKMQIRTAIKKLKLTHEITHETTRSFSIITINNWEQYQDNNTQDNIEITHKQHTDNTPITLTNNDKNDKNEKNIKKEKLKFGEFQNVLLTEQEYFSLQELYKTKIDDAIETLSNYLQSKGDKYKNHYAVMRKNNWVYEKVMNQQPLLTGTKGGYNCGF